MANEVREAMERVIAERGISWSALALLAGKGPKSLHKIRDGHEGNIPWETIRAVVRAAGLTYSDFFADSPPGAPEAIGRALAALPLDARQLLADILLAMEADREARERASLRAAASALGHRTGSDSGRDR